jgi:hypothetical protein
LGFGLLLDACRLGGFLAEAARNDGVGGGFLAREARNDGVMAEKKVSGVVKKKRGVVYARENNR